MNRDGFTLLAMGFTGAKAARFKEAYIERFNTMEAELRSRWITIGAASGTVLILRRDRSAESVRACLRLDE